MKSKKTKVHLETEVEVTFCDEANAAKYFIDSDWSRSFWQFEDLKQVSGNIAYAFHSANQCSDRPHLDGYGQFKVTEAGTYELIEEWRVYAGNIIIEVEDVDVDFYED